MGGLEEEEDDEAATGAGGCGSMMTGDVGRALRSRALRRGLLGGGVGVWGGSPCKMCQSLQCLAAACHWTMAGGEYQRVLRSD